MILSYYFLKVIKEQNKLISHAEQSKEILTDLFSLDLLAIAKCMTYMKVKSTIHLRLPSQIHFADSHIVRHLNIKAYYKIRCTLLTDPITKSSVTSAADSHFLQIDGPLICDNGKWTC